MTDQQLEEHRRGISRAGIGSMNKMFTAISILQLVQQGKLALDKPIATYWPGYPNHDLLYASRSANC